MNGGLDLAHGPQSGDTKTLQKTFLLHVHLVYWEEEAYGFKFQIKVL
jgi:hypothetical protein